MTGNPLISSGNPSSLKVVASAASLGTGTYTAHITINPATGTPTVVTATLTVTKSTGLGTITSSQTAIQFNYPNGQQKTTINIGSNDPAVTRFNVNIASQSNWLLFAGVTGSFTQVALSNFVISVDPFVAATLPTGMYTGTITLINPNVVSDVTIISVTLAVNLPGGGTNLALGKPATEFGGGDASLAVDGNMDGNFFNNSVSSTDLMSSPWWQVDLGVSATISSVVVWNRTDCCGSRLSDFWVFVSDTPFLPDRHRCQPAESSRSLSLTTAPNPSLAIPVNAQGRYVRIQIPNAQLPEPGGSSGDSARAQPQSPISRKGSRPPEQHASRISSAAAAPPWMATRTAVSSTAP